MSPRGDQRDFSIIVTNKMQIYGYLPTIKYVIRELETPQSANINVLRMSENHI